MDNIIQKICKRCVMDTTDPLITFDEKGICNHCNNFDEVTSKIWFPNDVGRKKIQKIYGKIKNDNLKNNYDCILGLSGGLDSSYLALKLHEAGMRPLLVHVDGGWNSELAVKNIENIINYCGWDLHTIVIDWEEMRDLQLAYFISNVANQDVPQDHAFSASLFHFALKHNIKYIMSGSNIATESILPDAWIGNNKDSINLRSIHKKFGKIKLKKYKTIGFYQYYLYYPFVKKIKTVSPLNFMEYNKTKALSELESKVGYRGYSRKHSESVFTKFYQNHWLPVKFGYDKRKAHFSSLILSNQMTREEALKELETPLYNDKDLKEDKEYIAKKLGISDVEFEQICKLPPHNYSDFSNTINEYKLMKKVQSFMRNKFGITFSNSLR